MAVVMAADCHRLARCPFTRGMARCGQGGALSEEVKPPTHPLKP